MRHRSVHRIHHEEQQLDTDQNKEDTINFEDSEEYHQKVTREMKRRAEVNPAGEAQGQDIVLPDDQN